MANIPSPLISTSIPSGDTPLTQTFSFLFTFSKQSGTLKHPSSWSMLAFFGDDFRVDQSEEGVLGIDWADVEDDHPSRDSDLTGSQTDPRRPYMVSLMS